MAHLGDFPATSLTVTRDCVWKTDPAANPNSRMFSQTDVPTSVGKILLSEELFDNVHLKYHEEWLPGGRGRGSGRKCGSWRKGCLGLTYKRLWVLGPSHPLPRPGPSCRWGEGMILPPWDRGPGRSRGDRPHVGISWVKLGSIHTCTWLLWIPARDLLPGHRYVKLSAA